MKLRITVQGLLSSKPGSGAGAAQKDALIEYYSAPDQRLLWVDNNGLNERAKLVIAPDWDAINAKRDEWTKRWNREVER